MRTFVFVSNIPDFLLESLPDGAKTTRNRDPRYERLRALLASHTSGVMLVMHLETRGFGLALYASEREALEACKTIIIPQQSGHTHSALLLRILERERPPPPQAVYTPTLTIEGVSVPKSALADTKGLELVYRGRAVPRWCAHTAAHEDCPFGVSCHHIHRAACQRTVQRRPRLDELPRVHMTSEEELLVRRLTRNTRRAEEFVIPPSLLQPDTAFVRLSAHEARRLVEGTADLKDLAGRFHGVPEGSVFAKFAIPGGAPWDWSLHDAQGQAALRRLAPFPDNGLPTPLERDLYSHALLYHMNQLNRFHTYTDALMALSKSPSVRAALLEHLQPTSDHPMSSAAENKEEKEEKEEGVWVGMRAWLPLPTPGLEASVLLQDGGDRVRGVVQRRGSVRLMTSATFLQRHDLDFTRYAVPGAGLDAEAESCLEEECRHVGAALRRGVEALRQHLRQQCACGVLPRGSAWCVQLATPKATSEEAEWGCVALSVRPYEKALEELSPVFPALATGEGAGTEVLWNLKRHQYAPLFPRSLLEKLRPENDAPA